MSELRRETRDLLAKGRHGVSLPSARRARIKNSLLATVAAGSVVGTTTSAVAWTSVVSKIVVAIGLVGTVGGVTLGVIAYQGSHALENVAAGTRHLSPQPSEGARWPTPEPRREVPPPGALEPPATDPAATPPIAEAPAPVAGVGVSRAPSSAEISRPSPAPTRVMPEPIEPAPAPSALGASAPQSANPVPAQTTPAAVSSSWKASSSLEQEAELLRGAHQALKKGDVDQALALLDEHAARFPGGALEPERLAERVLALCRAGRTSMARAAADSFLAAHAEGPLAARVRASCAFAR
jgi:hypothetical protein